MDSASGSLEALTVTALVLTHDAPESLEVCLAAIEAQTRRPDSVLVVDNASPVPAVLSYVTAPASVLRLGTNTGPAGGHAAGLRAFLDSPATFAWIMDDDCVAEPQCLEELLGAVTRNPPSSIFLPLWIDAVSRDAVYRPAWCGVLLPRRVVEGVGLPREDFVWWAEDTEYLTARMAANGVEVRRCELAVVEHQRVRGLQPRLPWKTYYEVRNTVYFRSRLQNGNVRVRMWRATKVLVKLLAKAVSGSSHDRGTQLLAYARGLGDGVLGRLGLRYPLP